MSVGMRRLIGLLLAGLVLTIDQSIKWLVFHVTNIHWPTEILPFFRIAYTENYGVSLGLLTADSQEMRWLLLALTSLIASGVFVWILRERRLGDLLALGLVLGGAVGNISDRFTHGFVVDYADLHFGDFRPFLIFNFADAAITIGIVTILLRSIFLDENGTTNRKVRKWVARKLFGHITDGEENIIKERIDG